MSDDMILHFSSNSSNQSDQSSKLAKLEARLVGKASSAAATQSQAQVQMNSWSAPSKLGVNSDSLPESLVDSDESDDDNGGAFLILANTQKRRKVDENCGSTVVERVEDGNISRNVHQAAADARQKNTETVESNKVGVDVNKRKQGRRANSGSGRGRGRISDQAKNQAISPSNGLTGNLHQKVLHKWTMCNVEN